LTNEWKTFKGGRSLVDVRYGWPSTVTCVEIKDQIDQRVQEKRREEKRREEKRREKSR